MKTKGSENYFLNNHLTDEAIAMYAEALSFNMESTLPDSVLEHVEECQLCRKEIMAIYDTMKEEGTIEGMQSHQILINSFPDGKTSLMPKIYQIFKYAAIFIVFISIGGLGYYFISYNKTSMISKNNEAISPNSVNSDNLSNDSAKLADTIIFTDPIKPINKENSTVLSQKHNQLALYMHESPMFENLLASQYRSNDIEVIAPLLKQEFTSNQSVIFKFKGDFSNPHVVIIYNNKGEKLIEEGNISTNSDTLGLKLSPGLYYWKLESGDNLLHVGKFFVK